MRKACRGVGIQTGEQGAQCWNCGPVLLQDKIFPGNDWKYRNILYSVSAADYLGFCGPATESQIYVFQRQLRLSVYRPKNEQAFLPCKPWAEKYIHMNNYKQEASLDFGGLLPFLIPGRLLILCRIPPSPALKKISFSPCVINWLSNDGDCFQERRIYYG